MLIKTDFNCNQVLFLRFKKHKKCAFYQNGYLSCRPVVRRRVGDFVLRDSILSGPGKRDLLKTVVSFTQKKFSHEYNYGSFSNLVI